jgi:hypothetical protein
MPSNPIRISPNNPTARFSLASPRPSMRRLPYFAVFDPRRRSLLRGSLLVLGSLTASFRLSGFPHSRPTLLLIIPAIFALLGTLDTVRCMQPRWNFYHGGVILLLLMDAMVLCLILFFLLFPYFS